MSQRVLFGGRVWGQTESDAILMAEGRIVRVGSSAELADADAEWMDARGGAILPGFVDGHTHFVESGLTECGWHLDLSGCRRDEALDRIAAAARLRAAGEWLVATGWDESRWAPPLRLRRDELDRAAPAASVVAVRVDGHLAVLNTPAVVRAARSIAPQHDLFDAIAGEAREAVVDALRQLARPDPETMADALRAAAKSCHRVGITTAHVMTGPEDPFELLALAESLRLRLVIHPPIECLGELIREGIRTGDGDEWARWGGVKLFADGSVGAGNAAVSAPYLFGGRGRLNHPLGDLVRELAAADHAGWQTLTHAIGDRAIGQVLRAHRRAGCDRGLRHRIEHYEFPTERQVEETQDLGLSLCMQPNFIGNWSGRGGLYDTALGAKRDAACNPLRAVLEAGIPLGFGSDGMPLGPLYGIASAVRAPHRGQQVTLEEAVRGYTVGSALLSGNLPGPGILAAGSVADIVVLDGPLSDDGLARRSVAQTWVGSERMYSGMEDR